MKIAIAYILFNPDVVVLKESVNNIYNQVDSVLFVDNGSNNIRDFADMASAVHIIYLSENTGIASATNVAINYFKKLQFDYLIISDQDTMYSLDYIAVFKGKINGTAFKNVAAVVPAVYDAISDSVKPFYIKKRIWMRKIIIENDAIVYQAIASGMIINLLCINTVGLMKEELFIDYVDFEWCWRVYYNKWKILAFPSMHIYHKLGVSIRTFGRKVIHTRSVTREYYITRNAFYLALYSSCLSYIDRIVLFGKAISFLLGYIILSSDIERSFKYCFMGFVDGISKRMGKLNTNSPMHS
jgi:rhamnosyltransferase